MAYEKKNGDISLFKNDKGDNEKRPDMRGEALIDGRTYRVSLWTKTSQKDGKKFLSGKIEAEQPVAQAAVAADDSADSGMPF
jgi:uncharacterized protein (DUF736 family)